MSPTPPSRSVAPRNSLPADRPPDPLLRRALDAEDALLTQPEGADEFAQLQEELAARAHGRALPQHDAGSRSKVRTVPAATAIVQQAEARTGGLEETILELYHADVSLRGAEEICHALWGQTADLAAIASLSHQLTERIGRWLERSLAADYPFLFFAALPLARHGDARQPTLCLLVALGVNPDGFRELLGIFEAEDGEAAWSRFLPQLRARGVKRARYCVGGYHPAFLKAIRSCFPSAVHQGCTALLQREVLSLVPAPQAYIAIDLLRTVQASHHREEAVARLAAGIGRLRELQLPEAAALLEGHAAALFRYFDFPRDQWRRVNSTELLNKVLREFRERARILHSLGHEHAAVTLLAARLRFVLRTAWRKRRYLHPAKAGVAA